MFISPTGPDQVPERDTHCPAPKVGKAEDEKPKGNTTTGKPLATAALQANAVPREDGEPKKATSPPDAAPTRAKVRRDKRTRGGNDAPPPAHHCTGAPELAADCTPATLESWPTAPAPDWPKAQKIDNRSGAMATPALTTRASAPEAQPTRTECPAPMTCHTTRATRTLEPTGKDREPQKPTEPEPNMTPHPGPTCPRAGTRKERKTGKKKENAL